MSMPNEGRIYALEVLVDALEARIAEHQTALARANKAVEELEERVSVVESDITTRGLLESANRPRRDVQEMAEPESLLAVAPKFLRAVGVTALDVNASKLALQAVREAATIGAREHHDKLAAEDLAREPTDRRGGALWWKVRRP